jgi:thiol:disulfide interchange protein DsbD
MRIFFLTVVVVTLFPLLTRADAGDAQVKAALLADAETVAPGSTFTLGVRLRMRAHWHTYWQNPGESGDPTTIKITAPPGFTAGPIQWPIPTRLDAPGGVSFGYEDEVFLLVPITVGKDVPVGTNAALEAHVGWLACKEECIKGSAQLKFLISVATATKPDNAPLFDKWRKQLPAEKSESITAIEQPNNQPALTIKWAAKPAKVEWFPISTRAVAINDVAIKTTDTQTQITFKPTVYKPEDLPEGKVQGVLTYEDPTGTRRGVLTPFAIPK